MPWGKKRRIWDSKMKKKEDFYIALKEKVKQTQVKGKPVFLLQAEQN